jgi:serine/threonine-protein kinase
MPLETADALIDALRGRPILRPGQFDELIRQHAPAQPDTQALARTLIRLGWLTLYQARKLLAGRADELVVGQYVILDKLGEGGMGRVYKATQLSLERVVALKVVRTDLVNNATALKRFRREVRAAADFRHPNIVSVFDADQVGDRHFLAMEFIEGADLNRLVHDRGPLPIPMACSFVRQAALGLQHAHDRGVVHRDIKPSNLLVAGDPKGEFTPRNVVKVLDMGLARIRSDAADQMSTELTRTGTVIGTPDFMSPEQAKNSSAVDHRSDLYSLGCTLYFLLTGDVPFPKGSPLEKLLQHQMDPPRSVGELRSDVPSEVATIVHTLLAKQPEDRFQSSAALAHALEPWCATGGPTVTAPASPPPAEAVDPSSLTLETEPEDPFDFTHPEAAHTPRSARRTPPPLPSRAAEKQSGPWPWVLALGAVFLVFLMVGAITTAVLLGGRKKPDDPPAKSAPPRQDPPRPAPPRAKADPPPAKDLEAIDKYLPNDAVAVIVFDLAAWQASPAARQHVLAPLAERLAEFKKATEVDLLTATERVVVGLGADNAGGDVVVLQGRSLVTPRLTDGVKAMPGVAAEPAWDGGPDLYRLGDTYAAATETSVILSSERGRAADAIKKRGGGERTKFVDPTVERGLEYAQVRPFAVFATLGLRQGWAQYIPGAAKLNFIAAGVTFEERWMALHTHADETEPGKAAEVQKEFGRLLAEQAQKANPTDLRLQRIADLLLAAEPARGPFAKGRRTHLVAYVPNWRLADWFAPFFPKAG